MYLNRETKLTYTYIRLKIILIEVKNKSFYHASRLHDFKMNLNLVQN